MTLKCEYLPEPSLEFGSKGRERQREIDIRLGLTRHGPLDKANETAPRSIKIAIIGTDETIAGLSSWLERCSAEIPGKKDSRQPNLFPPFPGFRRAFASELVLAPQLQRTLPKREIAQLLEKQEPGSNRLVEEAVRLFLSEMEQLDQPSPDVVLCALPMDLFTAMEQEDGEWEETDSQAGESSSNESSEEHRWDFHDLLKARAIKLRRPIQVVLPSTYDESQRRPNRTRKDRFRRTQDEATRAWNLLTALYYKAGGTPWRLVRETTDYASCFVGVSFYESLSGERIHTSTAQVFNERGDGIIVRGGVAKYSKEDRHVHLPRDEAERLLTRALQRYRAVHKQPPARIVLYKTSSFNDEELEGFRAAAAAEKIAIVDLLSVRKSDIRLFRNGAYPPLRGTCLYLSPTIFALYTRGSVPFFATYPGMYVPKTLEVDCRHAESGPQLLAREVLALTKMNWNNTQFDGGEPICTRAARTVGKILKYIDEGEEAEYRYSYYM